MCPGGTVFGKGVQVFKPLRFNGVLCWMAQEIERRDIVLALAGYVRRRYPTWGLTLRTYQRQRILRIKEENETVVVAARPHLVS